MTKELIVNAIQSPNFMISLPKHEDIKLAQNTPTKMSPLSPYLLGLPLPPSHICWTPSSTPSQDTPFACDIPPPLIDENSTTTGTTLLPVSEDDEPTSTGTNAPDNECSAVNQVTDDYKYEKDKLIIRNIQEEVSKEQLGFHLESNLEMEPKGNYSFELQEDSALLTFTKPYTVKGTCLYA